MNGFVWAIQEGTGGKPASENKVYRVQCVCVCVAFLCVFTCVCVCVLDGEAVSWLTDPPLTLLP